MNIFHSADAARQSPAQDNAPLANIATGTLRGRIQEGVNCFYAVPYAQAPVGELRFAAPQAAAPWLGVRDATEPGPVAPQLPSRLSGVMGEFERAQSEDCLTLTVWTPAVDARRRPVLVWLHGGAYVSGGGDLPWYDGARLAREGDMVVVAINYRLAALGFLYAPGLSPSNLGLMDQLAALDWVREHIAAFGGDPDQVTLMGQSAGAHSIALMLTHPEKVVPVQRAILMSAPLGVPALAPEIAERVGEVFMRALKVQAGDTEALSKLQQAPLADILAAQVAAMRFYTEQLMEPGSVTPAFFPIGDGQFAPTHTTFELALAAAAGKIDVLVGTTRDEETAFVPYDSTGKVEDAGKLTVSVFAQPTKSWAAQAVKAGRSVYLYRFDWASPHTRLGATHCIELPFVFGTRNSYSAAAMMAGADPEQVDTLSAAIRAAWISFVRTGNPSPSPLPSWPACTALRMPCMHLDQISAVADSI